MKIEEKIIEIFENICLKRNLNCEKEFKNIMKKFIAVNTLFDENKSYILTNNFYNDEIIKIVSRENDFLTLSNGNILHVLDFERFYIECIDLDNFLASQSVAASIIEQLKKEDNSN